MITRMIRTLMVSLGLVGLLAIPVSAATTEESLCTGAGGTFVGGKCNAEGTQKVGTIGDLLTNVTSIILLIVGAVTVILITIGGIRYAVSGGDGKQATDAKNTVIYAIVGLIVAFLAYALILFIISSFKL